MSIKIDLSGAQGANLDAFNQPTAADYPDGRYVMVPSRVSIETKDKSGRFSPRVRVAFVGPARRGRPALRVTDILTIARISAEGVGEITFPGVYGIRDLLSCCGVDSDSSMPVLNDVTKAIRAKDMPALERHLRSLGELLEAIPGQPVSVRVEWSDGDISYPNVRGNQDDPSYLPPSPTDSDASFDEAPVAGPDADDVDAEPAMSTPTPRRNLSKGRRRS